MIYDDLQALPLPCLITGWLSLSWTYFLPDLQMVLVVLALKRSVEAVARSTSGENLGKSGNLMVTIIDVPKMINHKILRKYEKSLLGYTKIFCWDIYNNIWDI